MYRKNQERGIGKVPKWHTEPVWQKGKWGYQHTEKYTVMIAIEIQIWVQSIEIFLLPSVPKHIFEQEIIVVCFLSAKVFRHGSHEG